MVLILSVHQVRQHVRIVPLEHIRKEHIIRATHVLLATPVTIKASLLSARLDNTAEIIKWAVLHAHKASCAILELLSLALCSIAVLEATTVLVSQVP